MRIDLRRTHLSVVAAVAVALVAGRGEAAAAPDAQSMLRGDSTYSDHSGDAPLDITAVTVGKDGTHITFRVDLPNAPSLGDDDHLVLAIDTDRNEQTGDHGLEYALALDNWGSVVAKWNGSHLVPATSQAQASADYAEGAASISIEWSDLGRPTAFSFFVVAFRGQDRDDAPDLGSWEYAPPNPAITAGTPSFAPRQPRAGRTFAVPRVSLHLDDDTSLPPDYYSCRATIGGVRLAPSGSGSCSWTLPRTARGKRLVVVVTVGLSGKELKLPPYAFRVR
jgi:hypothetical protein